jgi:hypothetical protein
LSANGAEQGILFLFFNAGVFEPPAAIAEAGGSTAAYFGPKKPNSVKDGNFIETVPGKGWWVILRLYSPLKPSFDKTWRPSEIMEFPG